MVFSFICISESNAQGKVESLNCSLSAQKALKGLENEMKALLKGAYEINMLPDDESFIWPKSRLINR